MFEISTSIKQESFFEANIIFNLKGLRLYPTLEEVLSQIPKEYFSRVAAFESALESSAWGNLSTEGKLRIYEKII